MLAKALLVALLATTVSAQEQPVAPQVNGAQSSIPLLIKFRGIIPSFDALSSGSIAITFALYKEQNGGTPLWIETQNVSVDAQGKFSVLLGAASVEGLPPDIFASGDARWLGIAPNGETEEARVALISVPYAFKAADADTVGGRSPSQFITQDQLGAYFQKSPPIGPILPPRPCENCFGDMSTAAAFLSTAPIGPSFLSNATSGPPLQVESNAMVQNLNADFLHGFTDSDFAKLGSSNPFTASQQFGGGAIFPPIPGNGATPEPSNPLDFQANGATNSGSGLVIQTFRWQANGSSPDIPQAQLSLLSGSAGQTPQPTGLAINADGTINFAATQAWPGSTIWQAVAPYAPGGSNSGSGGGSGGTSGGVSQSPTGTQTINQPPGSSLNINNLNNTRTVQASDNWQQNNLATPLTAGVQASVTLSPCPIGVDTSGSPNLGGPNGGYPVYIADQANPHAQSESVYVTGGTCTSGATSGTIVFTPYFSHLASGYTIGSDSSGIQEAINEACGTSAITWQNSDCNIIIPPTGPQTGPPYPGYNAYDTIYFHSNSSTLNGTGSVINCNGRGPCLQIGDLLSSNDYTNNTVEGISFRSPINHQPDPAFNGSLIESTQRAGGTITIQTATPHNLRTGDRVTQLLTDVVNYWGDVPSIVVTDPTHYTYTRTGTADIPQHVGPGIVALTYEAVLDNGASTILNDIQYANTGEYGTFNNFFDFWDDENAQINSYANNAASMNMNANWTASHIFSGGALNLPNKSHQLAPVITVSNSSITANGSNCATIYNSNGFYFQNSVCQAQGPWEFLVSTVTGNYQGASFLNVYSEAALSANPSSPVQSPWPGLGVAGLIAGPGGLGYTFNGTGGLAGQMPTVGGGATTFVYYVVARDLSTGSQTAPLPFLYEQENSPSQVLVQWPRLANGADTISYDVIRNPAPNGSLLDAAGGYVAPYTGGCNGGSYSACGSVAVGLPQCSGLVCSMQDNTGNSTFAYTVGSGNFQPNPTFWPASVVLSNTPFITSSSIPAVGMAFGGAPDEYATYCGDYGANVSGGYTQCVGTPTTSNNAVVDQPATLFTDGGENGGGGLQGVKGRLIFETTPTFDSSWWHQIITLHDSNPAKTQATTGHRPVGDPGDMYAGIDKNGYLMIGGGTSGIADYVDNIGDGVSWGEQLTSALKTFHVPVNMVNGLQLNGSYGTAGQCIMSTGNGVAWGTPGNASAAATTATTSPSGSDDIRRLRNGVQTETVVDPSTAQTRMICSKMTQVNLNDAVELTCRVLH